MKKILFGIMLIAGSTTFGQVPDVTPTPKNKSDNYPQNNRQHNNPVKTSQRPVNRTSRGDGNSPAVQPTPGNRATEVNRSNAVNSNATNTNSQNNTQQSKASPFVGGIQAAPNAHRSFDTLVTNGPASSTTVGTVIPGGNNTNFNANTIPPVEGVTTASGAVDRSGQAQFGQANWGRSERNTVGESQWTIPPPITASFNREFPAANNATWVRNQVDTNRYSVRHNAGASWVTSTYDASGTRIEMRTDIPLIQPPAAVSAFIAKQPSTFRVASISRVQVQGRPEVYELRLANGQSAYVNNEGMEVKF